MTTLTRRGALAAAAILLAALPVRSVAGSDEEMHDHIDAGSFRLHAPYARIMGKTARSGGVFLGIENRGDTADRLIAVQSPIAKKAMMHRTEITDGIMSMLPIKGGVPLAPGEMHMFKRGGDHIMLMGLTAHPGEGEPVPLTLVFEHAGSVDVEVPVDNARKPHKGGMDHMKMDMDGDG